MQCWWEGEKAFFIGKVLSWFSESHFPFLKSWNKKCQKLQTSNNNEKNKIKKHEEKKWKYLHFKTFKYRYSALRTISEEFVECLTKLENVMSKVVTE